jgi:hypothetical protein
MLSTHCGQWIIIIIRPTSRNSPVSMLNQPNRRVSWACVGRILCHRSALVAAGAENWRTYHNTRFATTAQIPADWRPRRVPENNDGREFVSPAEPAKIIASGIFSLAPQAEEIASRAEAGNGETIPYHE